MKISKHGIVAASLFLSLQIASTEAFASGSLSAAGAKVRAVAAAKSKTAVALTEKERINEKICIDAEWAASHGRGEYLNTFVPKHTHLMYSTNNLGILIFYTKKHLAGVPKYFKQLRKMKGVKDVPMKNYKKILEIMKKEKRLPQDAKVETHMEAIKDFIKDVTEDTTKDGCFGCLAIISPFLSPEQVKKLQEEAVELEPQLLQRSQKTVAMLERRLKALREEEKEAQENQE